MLQELVERAESVEISRGDFIVVIEGGTEMRERNTKNKKQTRHGKAVIGWATVQRKLVPLGK